MSDRSNARRIDHLVLAVHDLDAAAELYRRLGFQVGARNRHPWGTENRLVQLRSSFLELITVGDAADIPEHAPGSFSFGAFVRDRLQVRQGLAMVVLDSDDAVADAAAFARAGIGDSAPFSFERSGQRPDGSATHVAFTLAFARDVLTDEAGFFVCQQHFPEAFWNPQLQLHDNRAHDVLGVDFEVADPPHHVGFLQPFTGVLPAGDGLTFPLRGAGRLQLRPGAGAGHLAGFSIGVPDLITLRQQLVDADLPHLSQPDRVVVEPDVALGVRIDFEVLPEDVEGRPASPAVT